MDSQKRLLKLVGIEGRIKSTGRVLLHGAVATLGLLSPMSVPSGPSVPVVPAVVVTNREERERPEKLILELSGSASEPMLASHQSHRSHRSHSSHRSHRSHQSHRSHYSSSTRSPVYSPPPPPPPPPPPEQEEAVELEDEDSEATRGVQQGTRRTRRRGTHRTDTAFPFTPRSFEMTPPSGLFFSEQGALEVVVEIKKISFDPKKLFVLITGEDRQGEERLMLLYPQTRLRKISTDVETELGSFLKHGVASLPLKVEEEILVLWKPTQKTLEGEKVLGVVKITTF